MPGSGTGALPMPRRTGTPTFRTRRSGGVRRGAVEPGAVCRSVRWIPRRPGVGVQDLPRALRQEPLLGRRPCGRRPVEIRAYADRLECWQDGQVVGRHERAFGRGKTIYDPLHYIPVLARKPGALRNGAPFKDWDLPPALRRVQRKLERQPGGRPAGGRDPRGRAHRRAGGRRSRLLRGFGPQRPFRRRRSEHPGASPRTATAPDNHDAGCTEVGPRARGPIAIATTA